MVWRRQGDCFALKDREEFTWQRHLLLWRHHSPMILYKRLHCGHFRCHFIEWDLFLKKQKIYVDLGLFSVILLKLGGSFAASINIVATKHHSLVVASVCLCLIWFISMKVASFKKNLSSYNVAILLLMKLHFKILLHFMILLSMIWHIMIF